MLAYPPLAVGGSDIDVSTSTSRVFRFVPFREAPERQCIQSWSASFAPLLVQAPAHFHKSAIACFPPWLKASRSIVINSPVNTSNRHHTLPLAGQIWQKCPASMRWGIGLHRTGLSMITLRARPKHRPGRGNRGLR